MYKKIQYLSIIGVLGIVWCESSKGTEVEGLNNMNGIFLHKAEEPRLIMKNNLMTPVSEFIKECTKYHPLNQQNIDQARKDLEDLNIYEKPSQLVDKASLDYDPVSLGLVGAAYANNFRIPKALPWLFASAKENNPDSLWLLSSLYQKGLIHSENPKIAEQLKEMAFILKGNNAKEYFGE